MEGELDPFSRCMGAPFFVFVNPFQCEVDPFNWKELNDVAADMEDVERGLYAMGLRSIGESAIYYLTGE